MPVLNEPPPAAIPTRRTYPPYPQPLGALSVCSRCGALIRWVTTARGATCPVDAAPVLRDWRGCYDDRQLPERGAVVFTSPASVYHLKREDRVYDGETVYLSHFATCPFAAAFKS